MSTSNQKVKIGGVTIPIATTKRVVNENTTAFYKKTDRDNLDTNKLNELFMKAVATQQKKYDFIDLKINDPDMLKDTYNLEMAIETTRINNSRFDMHDVFMIVEPDDDPTKFKVHDLYKNHATLTEAQVAKSNEWYLTMTEDPNNKWFQQNMSLTYEYLVNNVEDSLQSKVKETYLKYPVEQKGGPLFFKIMIDILQNNSSEAAKYLISTVKDIKISNYDGENVEQVVSLIRGATSRLENLLDDKGKTAIPEDFVDDLIDILQTTSVSEFNELFSHYSRSTKLTNFISGAKVQKPSISNILKFAEEQYRILYSSGKWTGVQTKLGETAFTSNTGRAKYKCFNCGGDHRLEDCPVKKNDERIRANRKLFYDNKTKKSKSKGKWARPTKEEQKNKSRRVIDGKEHYYHYKDKRWKPVDIVVPEKTNVVQAEVKYQSSSETNPLDEANRSKKLEETFSSLKGLLSQFE